MDISVIRTSYLADRTIGKLSVNDEPFCDTLEPSFTTEVHQAIPTGCYPLTLHVQSPKFLQISAYKEISAKMPRLLKVPNRDGILIHPGNKPEDTAGCILVGTLTVENTLQESRKTFFRLYDRMKRASQRGEPIRIFII